MRKVYEIISLGGADINHGLFWGETPEEAKEAGRASFADRPAPTQEMLNKSLIAIEIYPESMGAEIKGIIDSYEEVAFGPPSPDLGPAGEAWAREHMMRRWRVTAYKDSDNEPHTLGEVDGWCKDHAIGLVLDALEIKGELPSGWHGPVEAAILPATD